MLVLSNLVLCKKFRLQPVVDFVESQQLQWNTHFQLLEDTTAAQLESLHGLCSGDVQQVRESRGRAAERISFRLDGCPHTESQVLTSPAAIDGKNAVKSVAITKSSAEAGLDTYYQVAAWVFSPHAVMPSDMVLFLPHV
jgi:hypothetical protein